MKAPDDPPMLAGLPRMKAEPLTEAQAKRVASDENTLAQRRRLAAIEFVFESRPMVEGEVNCARCYYLGDFNAERQVGWCMFVRMAVSTWHPVKCEAFERP